MKSFKLEEADKFLAAVSVLMTEGAKKGLVSAAERTAEYITTDVIPESKPSPPEDKGIYKAGWKAAPHPEGAIVFNDVPYASVIETGAKAQNIFIGQAMIKAIAEWVRRKGIGDRTVTSKNGVTRVVKASVTEATSIAWAIAKSMQKKGIFGDGLKVFERASQKIPDFIREEVKREIEKA